MSRSIVCGVDGSDASLAAAAVAARLCQRVGSALLLAHADERGTKFAYANEAGLSRRPRRIDAEMTRLFERIQRRFSRVEITGRIVDGDPADELVKLAAEEDAILLVVGSRGRGAVKAALLGSVSSAVVRACDCPVVIVPPDARLEQDQRADQGSAVVCGVGLSEEGRSAARVAADLASALRLDLVLVHAYASRPQATAIPAPGASPTIGFEDAETRERDRARRLLEQVARDLEPGPPLWMRVEADDPASALDRCAKAENAELIVVGTHGHGPVTSALLGSTSSRLAATASRPVVVVPKHASLPHDNALDTAGVQR
ncbi:MAG: universal stress protein [Thermoleophilaceae bacterium]|nr:universal stress protein [Thermoleophilaceae bacterium]